MLNMVNEATQMPSWLVVWNMAFIFHFRYGMSSFPLTFIFFKMVETTNQLKIKKKHNLYEILMFSMDFLWIIGLICIYMDVNGCISMYSYIYMYVCIYIYIYIYMDVYGIIWIYGFIWTNS